MRADAFRLSIGVSIVIGGVIGWGLMPEPRAIDGALVLSGMIKYPPGSIQGIYFHNVWTFIHQILSIPLALGGDQAAVANTFNALLGAVMFTGLALVTLALTESIVLAVTSPLLIMFSNFWLVWSDYPILFFASHSYGQLGLAACVLSIGLLGNGRPFAAGVVAGILPSVHSVWGGWTIAIILAAGGLLNTYFCVSRKQLAAGVATGLAVSAVSFGWFVRQRLSIPSGGDPALLQLWMDLWEHHRSLPYKPRTIFLTSLFMCGAWMLFDAAKRAGRIRVAGMTIMLFVTAAAAQVLYELAHHAGRYLPDLVVNAMPGRLVNLHFLLAYPALLALMAARTSTILPLAVSLPIMAFDRKLFHAGYLFLVLFFGAIHFSELKGRLNRFACVRAWRESPPPVNRIVTAIGIIGVVWSAIVVRGMMATPEAYCTNEVIDDCRAPAIFQQLSGTAIKGLVAAPAGLALTMHRHGHQPVIAGASGLDFVAYLPGTVTSMRDMLEAVYGIDFANPSEEIRGKPYLLPGQGKRHWASLTSTDWEKLSDRFCIGAVLVPEDWQINLLPTVDGNQITLYVFPWLLPSRCMVADHPSESSL